MTDVADLFRTQQERELANKEPNIHAQFNPAPLDFEVEKRVVKFSLTYGGVKTRDKMYVIVRTDSQEGLGVVGDRYRLFQNSELIQFAKDVTKISGCLRSCGSWMGGQRVWLHIEMPKTVYGGTDLTTSMVVRNSHDSSQCLTLQMVCKMSPHDHYRPVVLPMYKARHSFRHLPSGKTKLDDLAKCVEYLQEKAKDFARGLEELSTVWLDTEDRVQLAKDVLGVKEVPPDRDSRAYKNFWKFVDPNNTQGSYDAQSWFVNVAHMLSMRNSENKTQQSLIFGSLGTRIESVFETLKTRHFVETMARI